MDPISTDGCSDTISALYFSREYFRNGNCYDKTLRQTEVLLKLTSFVECCTAAVGNEVRSGHHLSWSVASLPFILEALIVIKNSTALVILGIRQISMRISHDYNGKLYLGYTVVTGFRVIRDMSTRYMRL